MVAATNRAASGGLHGRAVALSSGRRAVERTVTRRVVGGDEAAGVVGIYQRCAGCFVVSVIVAIRILIVSAIRPQPELVIVVIIVVGALAQRVRGSSRGE